MSLLELKNISKSYLINSKEKLEVLQDISFTVEDGQFVTFFGPNGCGKTTLLNLIAGLIKPDNGIIKVNSKENKGNIGYVFQNYDESLFPWEKNIDNISFPLRLKGFSFKESRKKVLKFIEELDLIVNTESYPYQSSGGQKQLTVLARSLINNPDFLLLDEPFSSLDYQTRLELQEKIIKIWEKTKKTILFVSHDIDEAILLADKIILLGKRPANIIEIISNDIERPRKRTIINSKKFQQIKNQMLDLFLKQVSLNSLYEN